MNFEDINKIPFSWLCDQFEKISRADKIEKKRLLTKQTMSVFEKGEAFHVILRLFLPELDRVRGAYGVKEHNLAKTYIRILGLPPDGGDAKKLLNYGAAGFKRGDCTGDFAEVAYWILVNKCGETKKLTIGDVNTNLNAVAEKNAAHDRREWFIRSIFFYFLTIGVEGGVDNVLTDLINKMSATEQKWLIRIILKKMHLGISKDQILKCYHPDASDLYDSSNSLHKICCTLREGVRLHEICITMFESFRPMLCARNDVNDFKLTEPMYLETKMDGERFQIHYQDGKFKYFSRNGFEFTQNYGEDEFCGNYTRSIKRQFQASLKSFILDGEMMGWNTNRKQLVTKAANVDVKSLRIGNIIQPCFFAFDIIFLDGKVLTNLKLSDRIDILEKVFTPLEGIIMATPREIVNTTDEVFAAVNSAIDRREEGIVMKKMDSIYKPNARNAGWFKIKPEYSENSLVELDVLIIGGYYGSGKYKNQVSHFLLGLAQPNPEGPPQFFESLARVGSGLSNEELEEVSYKLSDHWKKFRAESTPKFLLLASEKPHLWIEPNHSLVLQVKATEVEKSTKYYCGYSLRFVRIERARYDKPWKDCLTSEEFHKLRQESGGKLTSGHIQKSTKDNPRKRTNEIDSVIVTKKIAREQDLVCNIFDKIEFCVLSGDSSRSKEKIEEMIIKHGGAVRNIPTSTTSCIIAGKPNIQVKNAMKSAIHPIVHVDWVLQCVAAGKYLNWTPALIIGSTFTVNKLLDTKFDQYGDSYSDEVTPDGLRSIFQNMKTHVSFEQSILAEIDYTVFEGSSPFSFFRNITAFFPADVRTTDFPPPPVKMASTVVFPLKQEDKAEIKYQLEPEKNLFTFYGGEILERPDENVRLVIIRESSEIPACVSDLISNFGSMDIVSCQWINDCCSARTVLSKDAYLVTVA